MHKLCQRKQLLHASSTQSSHLDISVELVHDLLLLLVAHVNFLHVIPEVYIFISGQLLHLEIQSEGHQM